VGIKIGGNSQKYPTFHIQPPNKGEVEHQYGGMSPTTHDVGRGHRIPLQGEDFRLGLFKIEEERDDYLLCRGYDPHAHHRHKQLLKISKPSLLLKTPWDGQTVTLGNRDVTFEYIDIGKRIARAIIDDELIEEVQKITMDYFPGDTIVAVQVRTSYDVDGMDVYTEEGGALSWLDLNMSGRCWAVDLEEEA